MIIIEKVVQFDAGTIGISFTYYPTLDKSLTLKEKKIVNEKEIVNEKDLKSE